MLGMQIEPTDLFAGEKVLVSKNANAMITLNDYALKAVQMEAGNALQLIGYAAKDAIGGKLHVTNYRLIFKSHPLNRARGKFSVFLDTIRDVKDIVRFSKRVEVGTLSQRYEFVIWGIPAFLQQINAARSAAPHALVPALQQKIENDYSKVGNGFKNITRLDVSAGPLANTGPIVKTPFGFANLLNVMEMLGKRR